MHAKPHPPPKQMIQQLVLAAHALHIGVIPIARELPKEVLHQFLLHRAFPVRQIGPNRRGKKYAVKSQVFQHIFQLLIAALVKTITLRPKMNRFIQGYRIYQRNVLTMGFVVKKEFKDEAHEALAFIPFEPDTTVETVHNKILEEIHSCRSDAPDNSTAGMEGMKKLPKPLLTFVMWLMRKLDFYGRVPEFLVKTDPNYATCFITNLGSIKLRSGYHHLSNWGTNSIFVIIGEKKLTPFYDEKGNVTMKETIDLGLTIDERIADGFYYSKTIKLLKHLLQHPELLELPANQEVEYE